jgi:NTP pyrophosphatase (non-canonical NTP hydrolase)
MESRVTFDTFRDASLDDYHFDFSEIWARDLLERSVLDLWLHVVDHASRIARAIRRQEPSAVTDDIADTTVWLMSFIAQCQKTSSASPESCFRFTETPLEIIWQKYPAICPGCFDHWIISLLELTDGEVPFAKLEFKLNDIGKAIDERASLARHPEPCTCVTRLVTHRLEREIATGLRTELDDLRHRYARAATSSGQFIQTTLQLEEMFNGLYENVHHILTLETIAFHLLEEVGEASEAIKDMYTFDTSREPYSLELQISRKDRLLEEIADVFSWIITMALKIRSTYVRHAEEYRNSVIPSTSRNRFPGLDFAQIIWAKYGMTRSGANWDRLKCPGCQSAPCSCLRDMRIGWADKTQPPSPAVKPSNLDVGAAPAERDLIFVSYSHHDQRWLERLQTVIKPLIRNKTLATWDDTRIRPGQRWRSEIDSALRRARAAVLLVTPNFLASDFIVQSELTPLLDAAKKEGVSIIWVPLSASMYEETEIKDYQAAYDPSRPLDGLPEYEQNAALVKICEYIKQAVQ